MADLLIPQRHARKCGNCTYFSHKVKLHGNYSPCTQKDNEIEGTLCLPTATECQFFEQLKSKVTAQHAARKVKQAFQALATDQLQLNLGDTNNGK